MMTPADSRFKTGGSSSSAHRSFKDRRQEASPDEVSAIGASGEARPGSAEGRPIVVDVGDGRGGDVKIFNNVLEAVGGTPIVRMGRMFADDRFEVYAKFEALNPGGSIKDRPALEILEHGFRAGAIGPETVIVESSSGNMGIGLAQACRYHGLRFICVVDVKASKQNLRVLRAYGAEIDMVTEPDPSSGEFLQARLQRVDQLVSQLPHSFWPNQYANLSNPSAHYRTTMREICDALGDRIDFLFVATSTCGTVRGCAEYARDRGLPIRVVAVDAKGSLIFSDQRGVRRIPGLGAGLRPPLCDLSLIDRCVHVDDIECITTCRRVVREEALLVGGSSGGVVRAIEKMRHVIPAGSVCVAILPDRGERYLETIYDDEWVSAHFGGDALPQNLLQASPGNGYVAEAVAPVQDAGSDARRPTGTWDHV
jgi:cysteine synthase A